MSRGVRLGVFAALGVGETVAFLLSAIALIFAAMEASQNLFRPFLHNILRHLSPFPKL